MVVFESQNFLSKTRPNKILKLFSYQSEWRALPPPCNSSKMRLDHLFLEWRGEGNNKAFGLPKPSLFCNVQRDVASLPSYGKLNSKCNHWNSHVLPRLFLIGGY